MKIGTIGLVCLAVLSSCSNQHVSSTEVPSVVQNVVKAKYPDAKEVEWKNLGHAYEADIDVNDSTEIVLQVSKEGRPLGVKEDIAAALLPAAVIRAVQSSYADYTIDEAERLEREGLVYYQVELEGRGKKDLQLVFAEDGTVNNTTGYWD